MQVTLNTLALNGKEEELGVLMPTLFMSLLEVYFHILFHCTSEA